MFGGIDAEAIDAVVAYPLAQPVRQVVARRIARDRFRRSVRFMAIEVRQARRLLRFGFQVRQEGQRHGEIVIARVVVIADIGADPLLTPPFLPTGLVAEVDIVVKAVPGLARAGLPVRPALAEGFFQLIPLQIQGAELELLHVGQGGVAGMVHHHVEQNTYSALMRFIHQSAEIRFGPHVGVQFRPVLSVIAVVGVVREIAFRPAADPAVDLLERGADPQGIDPHLLQIIQLAG